jgi:hypothetical protein
VTSASLVLVILTYLFISRGGIVFRSPLISTSFKMFRRDFSSSLPIADIIKIVALCMEKDTPLTFHDDADKRYDFSFSVTRQKQNT